MEGWKDIYVDSMVWPWLSGQLVLVNALYSHEARLGVECLAEPVAVAAEVVRDKVRVDAAAEAEDAVAHPVAALLEPDVSAMFDHLC